VVSKRHEVIQAAGHDLTTLGRIGSHQEVEGTIRTVYLVGQMESPALESGPERRPPVLVLLPVLSESCEQRFQFVPEFLVPRLSSLQLLSRSRLPLLLPFLLQVLDRRAVVENYARGTPVALTSKCS